VPSDVPVSLFQVELLDSLGAQYAADLAAIRLGFISGGHGSLDLLGEHVTLYDPVIQRRVVLVVDDQQEIGVIVDPRQILIEMAVDRNSAAAAAKISCFNDMSVSLLAGSSCSNQALGQDCKTVAS
jgi:hypothetical protein